MKNYAEFYEKLTKPVRTRSKWLYFVKTVNSLITRIMPFIYLMLLLYLFWTQKRWTALMPFVLVPSLSFVLLSLVRKYLNQPRPYERWTISPLIIKDAKGQSMPSRHVFSAVVISVCVLRVTVWGGIMLLILSALLACCRVLGGVHYPKDVIIGYLIGLLAGSLLFWV
ncbi:phosphatase PAP2 family protein [Streptococcus troglodytae]|uniref:phosphatase PAP2 family protein n=1 Tax=Streptococcus troglodytae TaxID=1111760 RepID=UPI00137AFA2B|nr:phosphatase PAP2 family protein [Streptococcus troglodytae]